MAKQQKGPFWRYYLILVLTIILSLCGYLVVRGRSLFAREQDKGSREEIRAVGSMGSQSRVRYAANFNASDYAIQCVTGTIHQDNLTDVLQKAVRQDDWLVINYIAEQFGNTTPGSQAKGLVRKHVQKYKSQYIVDIVEGITKIPSGGFGLISKDLIRPFSFRSSLPRDSFSLQQSEFKLILDDTHLPLQLSVSPLAFDANKRMFRAAIVVDPEAKLGQEFSFPITVRVEGDKPVPSRGHIDENGEYVADKRGVPVNTLAQCMDYEIRVRVDEARKFDSETVSAIYLSAVRAERIVDEKMNELFGIIEKLNLDNAGTLAVETQRVNREVIQARREVKIYENLLMRAALHQSKEISDIARKALVALQGLESTQVGIMVLMRGADEDASAVSS